jgi:hypothetical protein
MALTEKELEQIAINKFNTLSPSDKIFLAGICRRCGYSKCTQYGDYDRVVHECVACDFKDIKITSMPLLKQNKKGE